MFKHRFVVLVCLLVGIAVGYVLPRSIDTAEAGTTKLACVGEGVQVLNTTGEALAWQVTLLDGDGDEVFSNSFVADPHSSGNVLFGTARSSIVEADKGIRVLGWSGPDTGSNGYSECVKAK
jgi:hypothetical protein